MARAFVCATPQSGGSSFGTAWGRKLQYASSCATLRSGQIFDEEQSWPKKGNPLLDGFSYARIGAGPTSAKKRLEWLARQPDGFIPQPYRQLAKVLREAGDDAGARKVLIAMEDSRLKYGGLSAPQRVASRIRGQQSAMDTPRCGRSGTSRSS